MFLAVLQFHMPLQKLLNYGFLYSLVSYLFREYSYSIYLFFNGSKVLE
jgi:hypothetical protein